MPNWKKVIVSGSSPHFNNITASGVITASEFLGPGQVIVSGSSTVGGSIDTTASFKTLSFTGNAVSLVTSAPNTNKLVTVQINTGSAAIDPFPFTGDAQITGSLVISQSYTAGDTDSTALRLFGSGSISESGIFEVEGSAGPLFSVADGLDGVLMEVNNISGLPLLQVSSSNEVFINRGNLTSGVTTATASFAYFTGSFAGDGGGLTNLNVITAQTASYVETAQNANDLVVQVKNTQTSTILKGQVLHSVGVTGENINVITASNDSAASMPGFAVANQDISSNASGQAIISGKIQNIDTSGLTAGSNVYVNLNGDYTGTKPTGSSLIQNIGVVGKVNATEGELIILGAGRSNDVPNISPGYIWIGNSDSVATPTATSSIQNVVSSSYASTASYVETAQTASYVTLAQTASFALTSSLVIQQDSVDKVVNTRNINFTGNAVTLTTGAPNPGASVIVAINTGSAAEAFPFTGDAQITGSLIVSGSGGLSVESSGSTVFEVIGSEGTLFSIDDDLDGVIFTANDRSGLPVLEASASGEVYIGKSPQSLYTTAVISSTTADISQSIYGLSTSSYGGVFVDYTANSGSNARAGSIVSVWNGSSINFTETTTLDIGDTSNLLMQVAISQSQAQVQSYATTAGYNIKTIIKAI